MYKTGDPHPNPMFNSLGFVEYDEHGREVWTSVAGDSTAPFRCAMLSEQRREVNTAGAIGTADNQTCHRQAQPHQGVVVQFESLAIRHQSVGTSRLAGIFRGAHNIREPLSFCYIGHV